jgi:polysaccharide deacetylase 2 family uncharacterized protein YibQ
MRASGIGRALAAFFAFAGGLANAAPLPQISIIIDDMGYRHRTGLDAVKLPGSVAYSFLPHSPHAAKLASLAHGRGKEVMLHVPMQGSSTSPLGPGAVTANMSRIELMRAVSSGLGSVPYVSGINNHMGSVVTPRSEHMGWLMDLLRVRDNLFFVDSRTTRHTRAFEVARRKSVPSTWRDVFLDNEPDAPEIRSEFRRLLKIAKRRGTALAIGHPHPQTIAVLADVIPRLEEFGVRLVSVADMIRARHGQAPPFKSRSLARLPARATEGFSFSMTAFSKDSTAAGARETPGFAMGSGPLAPVRALARETTAKQTQPTP